MSAKDDLKDVMEAKAAELRAKQEAALHAEKPLPVSAAAKAEVEQQAQEGFLGAAAKALESSPEGDPPSEVEVGLDYDFLNYDPTDFIPHFQRLGLPRADIDHLVQNFSLRWVCTRREKYDKRIYEGWEPILVNGVAITRGDLVACRLPKAIADRQRAFLEQRKQARRNAPMKRFEQEVGPLVQGGNFSTFDDNSGPRIRK